MNIDSIKKIGITGGIGSGKTEACKILERLGEKVLYADQIAKDLTDNNEKVINKIKKVFGSEFYGKDGKLNRKKLANFVFNNPSKLNTLNSIVHPEVFRVIDEKIRDFANQKIKQVYIEAALIFESGMDENLDLVIVIDADLPIRLERVQKRDKMDKDDFMRRNDSQIPSEEKVKLADFTIKNNGSIEELERNLVFINNLIKNYYFNK